MFPFGQSKDIFATKNPELTFSEKLDIDEFIQDCQLELRHLGYVKAGSKRQVFDSFNDLKDEYKYAFFNYPTVDYFVNRVNESPSLKSEFAEVFDEIRRQAVEILNKNLTVEFKKEEPKKSKHTNLVGGGLSPRIFNHDFAFEGPMTGSEALVRAIKGGRAQVIGHNIAEGSRVHPHPNKPAFIIAHPDKEPYILNMDGTTEPIDIEFDTDED